MNGPDPRIVLALDVATLPEALGWAERFAGRVGLVKVGLELFTRAGPAAVHELADRGCDVFLDLKLHDIPRTVARTVEAVAALPRVRMVTVHTQGGAEMLREAVGAAGDRLLVLGVTVLTSLDAGDLAPVGPPVAAAELVVALAERAVVNGVRGLVTSGEEVAALRARVGRDTRLVVPGVRPSGAARGDQKRVSTPAAALAAGADYLVLGRPILEASDPEAALAAVEAELAAHPAARDGARA